MLRTHAFIVTFVTWLGVRGWRARSGGRGRLARLASNGAAARGGQAPGRSDFGFTRYDGRRRRARSFRRSLELHVYPGLEPPPVAPSGAVPPGTRDNTFPCHAESPVRSISLDPPGTSKERVGVSGDGEDVDAATSAAR